MNDKQRKTICSIRRKISRSYKIRSEQVYTFEFGRRVVYEVEVGPASLLNQHYINFTIGPNGGLKNEKKIF